ncbi:cytochrome c [bacterium SCSIO 12741]|nr:cytochrome c [bacterium SCSIO 12741]
MQTTQLDSLGLHQVIKNGRNSMPPYGGQLKDEEIGQIISFFNSFKNG